jgi:hypothetical protein
VVLFDAARLVDRLGGEQPPVEPWPAYVDHTVGASNIRTSYDIGTWAEVK